jgi:hypothetical protein
MSAPADHGVGVLLGQGRPGELTGGAADRAKERPFGIGGDPAAIQIGVQIGFKIVVARHLVPLAALLPEPHPEPAILHEQ